MVKPNLRKKAKSSRRRKFLIFIGLILIILVFWNRGAKQDEAVESLISSIAGPISQATEPVKTSTTKRPTVAYAVSFIKCGDFQTKSADLIDASLIMRHSIHKISSRNPASGSQYDYKIYAIVHSQAKECSKQIGDMGFEIVLVEPPVLQEDIRGEHLRKNIHKEWCCGHDEFVKLFAYTLPEEITVHVDIDFAFYKPMDHLFDAILFDKDSIEGQTARNALELERPNEKLPDKIGAFITRDWPQVAPGKWPPAYQAGFLVARRDPSIMTEMLEVIKEGNFTPGWGYGFGWGNLGYGGVVGSMAMQGLVAYYYDHIRPNNAVELNQCRHNHMGMDVLYRPPVNYRRGNPFDGKCRNGLDYCEDCMVTDMEKIYSIHYTMCRKPWMCVSNGKSGGRRPLIDTRQVTLSHCHEIVKKWHELRTDLENELYLLTKDETIKEGSSGTYKQDLFGGHCDGDDDGNYIALSLKKSFQRIQELYDKPKQ